MIKWLAKSYRAFVSILFVLHLIIITAAGVVGGFYGGYYLEFANGMEGGRVIFAVVGLFAGFIIAYLTGIAIFGLCATIIYISDTNKKVQDELELLNAKLVVPAPPVNPGNPGQVPPMNPVPPMNQTPPMSQVPPMNSVPPMNAAPPVSPVPAAPVDQDSTVQ